MADNVALVRSGYEAFARGDVATVLGLMADTVQWSEAEHVTSWPGGPFVGRKAVVDNVFAQVTGVTPRS
jgi:ketosteroid isomerase-like protein